MAAVRCVIAYLTDIPTDNPTICFDGNPDVAPRR
jgi:hypothetical protein